MSKLVRFVNHSLKDFFVSNAEDSCDSSNQFQDSSPYPFADGNLMAVLVCQSEEFADSLVCHEPLYNREYVVLQCNKRCTGNLGGKVVGLAFAKPKQSLALLEYDFQGPSSGIDLIGLEEAKFKVSAKQSAPRVTLASAYKEESYASISKDDVCTHIPALELTGILLLAPLVKQLDDCWSRKILLLEMVPGLACFSYLDHSDIVTFDVAASDKLYYLGACKPAVCQYVTELDLVSYHTSDHLYGKVYLAHGVFTDSGSESRVFISFSSVPLGEFLGANAKVFFLALLPKDGKVKKHLAYSICNTKEECLETEDSPVLKMGVYATDILHALSRLREIRIVNHQAGINSLMVTAHSYLFPQLGVDMVHELSPVGTCIIEELVEDILPATKLAA